MRKELDHALAMNQASDEPIPSESHQDTNLPGVGPLLRCESTLPRSKMPQSFSQDAPVCHHSYTPFLPRGQML